jgi:crotonobetainyl-CoA:carnitine CoA-transferase CaiB-like acyl-CoA transferase
VRALAGIRVVDLTSVVVGPTATLYLADYGADVIKVEALDGDLLRTLGGQSKSGELSGKFMHFNRNKRSLVLNLKHERGRAALQRLIETSDVFIANVRLAALERLGLDAEALRGRYRRLIVCNLMGFGRGGRYRNRPAYDTIIQGLSGAAQKTFPAESTFIPSGTPDSGPPRWRKPGRSGGQECHSAGDRKRGCGGATSR